MTTAAATPETALEPMLERRGDSYWAAWPDYMTRILFENIHEKSGALWAEVTVYVDIPGAPVPAAWTELHISLEEARGRLANRLKERWDGRKPPPYQEMLGAAAYLIRDRLRTGEPVQRIGGKRPVRETRYTVYPLLPENQISILYGDGASLKSMIAMSLGLSVQECRQLLPGTRLGQSADTSRTGPVAYFDYETNADEQHARMRRLAAGFGLGSYREMHYRECHIPLHKDAAQLRSLVDEYDYRMVIIDSMGAALGGDPNDAAVVIAAMNALRSLGTTVLCIDHVTKTDEQGKPIGSGYKWNFARAAFHAKRVQETDSDVVNVALVHTKANNDKLVSPLGFAVRFSEDEAGPITVKHLEIRDHEELAKLASSASRILHALKRGALSASDLKAAVVGEMKPATFDKTFKRLRDRGAIIVVPGTGGLYGLAV